MKLQQLMEELFLKFPKETAMDGDPIGIQVQPDNNEVSGLLITMEVTREVVDEAVLLGFNTILTFHPLIYMPLSKVSYNERVGNLVLELAKHSISLISLHTAFDAYTDGTSKLLTERIGLKVSGFLVPDKKYNDCGMGVIAESDGIDYSILLEKVNSICACPVRYCKGGSDIVKKIAIVGGSGYSFIDAVLAANCDAFITADVTYHKFHAVKGKVLLIDVGHYEMEQFVPKGIVDAIGNILANNNIKYKTSKIVTNPVVYLSDNDYYSKQKYILETNY